MLVRLEKKGFLKSDKNGKERNYYAVVSEDEYIWIEAENFRKRFNGGKLSGLVKLSTTMKTCRRMRLMSLKRG